MTDIVYENSLATFDQDILTELLRDKRSPNTRRTYSKGLKDFFVTMTKFEPSPDAVAWFLSLGRFQAISLVLRYRGGSVGTGPDSCDGECPIVGG